ncbi:MAG: hypothetical protein GYB32_03375 [Algicola sp.]|nr:hypothetical protein [Algicola sp.]
MTDLKAIIQILTPEEEQRYIALLERNNKRNDTKNIQLFKLLAQNELSSNDICFKIYNSHKKGAYHALRKRLYQSLIDFIANRSLAEENSVDMKVIKYILASRTFLIHKEPKIAYDVLDKAESLAQEYQLFPILNEIYHTKIQYAYLNPSIDLNDVITSFRRNQKQHAMEEELNLVYAKVRQTLSDMTYDGKVLDFETILKNVLKEHQIDLSQAFSFKSLYQLMTIVSISAFVNNDYLKIEPFLLATYQKIHQHKTKDKQLIYHIEVVYMIANTLFRNKKFNQSIDFLEQMRKLMKQQRSKYETAFKLKYFLLMALNKNYLGHQDEAIDLLESVKTEKHVDTESILDIHLSLVMFYMQKNDLKKAKSLYAKFYHTDNYYAEKAGKEWVIKKNLAEIILYIELGEIDLVDSRFLSFKRSYYKYLKAINQDRVIVYLNFVNTYYKQPHIVKTTAFKERVELAFDWVNEQQEDIFVMSFYAWLKSKMEQRDLYKTTLDLIAKAQNVN